MTTQEIVRASLSAITASGLDYVVVGAFATGHYAFPRATKDATGNIEQATALLVANISKSQ